MTTASTSRYIDVETWDNSPQPMLQGGAFEVPGTISDPEVRDLLEAICQAMEELDAELGLLREEPRRHGFSLAEIGAAQ